MREHRDAYAAAAAVVAGVAAGSVLPPSPGEPSALLMLAAAGVAVAVPGGPRRAAAWLALLLLACTLTLRAQHGLVTAPFAPLVDRRAAVQVEAVLVSDPVPGRHDARVTVRTGAVRLLDGPSVAAGDRHVVVKATRTRASPLHALEAGDGVEFEGRLRPLDRWDRSDATRHAVARLDLTDVVAADRASGFLAAVANRVRHVAVRGLEPLTPTDRGLAAGFLLGDRRGIPDDVADDFRAAGLTHLLAVSGSNVAFVLASVRPILARVGLRTRYVGGVAAITVFAAMTRFEPSVLRASAMAVIALTGSLVGRSAAGLRTLAIGVSLLLLADPLLAGSIAFRLSCGASAGILLWSARIRRRLRGPEWFRDTAATTLAAQAGVAPVLVATFGGIPLVALPANVLAVPVVGLVAAWAGVAAVVGGLVAPVVPEATAALQVPTVLMVRWVRLVAEVCAQSPFTVSTTGAVVVAIATTVVFAAARLRRRRALPAWAPELGMRAADR